MSAVATCKFTKQHLSVNLHKLGFNLASQTKVKGLKTQLLANNTAHECDANAEVCEAAAKSAWCFCFFQALGFCKIMKLQVNVGHFQKAYPKY